jgi:hypothetical protein
LTVEIDKEDTAPDWTFGGSWSYAPRFFEHEGVSLHYVDEGAGEPVVIRRLPEEEPLICVPPFCTSTTRR